MGSPTPSPALSENGLIATLAHETSHLHGLGERYIEFPCACNSGEKTVMSGGTLVIGLQDHCDGITGLEPIYDDRVTDYYPELMDVEQGKGPKQDRLAFPENEEITFRQLIGNTSGYMKPGEAPGKVFNYQTFGMNVLTHSIASAYRLYTTSDPERGAGFGTLTNWKIRNPIEGSWSWAYENFDLHPDARTEVFGYFTGYQMTPRDMARCGWLWLNRGNWNGVSAWSSCSDKVSSGCKSRDTFRARANITDDKSRKRRPRAEGERQKL